MIIGGGILNLTLGSTITTEECLEIIKKLDDISQNKFYTINVFDTVINHYLGSCELLHDYGDHYTLRQVYIVGNTCKDIYYIFNRNGQYIHSMTEYNLLDILSRLNKIEQKLNEITISETN